MDKTFEPKSIEARWYPEWERRGYFAPQGNGAPYCIMIPPPNVTGSLHMGHAFQDTLMDALTRYHRMKGERTLWQPGTDHAGIATQMVVERQLAAQNVTRHDLGRAQFIERVWQWKAESGGTITRQLRRIGASVDWSRERFTMDEAYSRSVIEHFVRLHDEGLIYRGKRLVNWDPVLLTAISDLEVVSEEESGSLWHLRYPLTDGSGHLVVATTRPETMLGDTAVAVNPDDDRYRHLIGKAVRLPLAERDIPIIGDEYVDPAFGSGCVKITPAHDFNDYAVGQRHKLPLINIFTPDAKLNGNAPAKYRGMDRFVARKQIIADLEAAGLIEKIDAHKLMVPRGDRSHSVVEPYLTDQWFVDLTREKTEDGRPGGRKRITEPAIRAVEDGSIRFVPENWSNTYYQWMRNIQDWCISRQIWWGHRIPAWYDDQGKVYVARNEAEARKKYSLDSSVTLRQDEDTFDTWFSSDIWPIATLGWPEQTPELKTFYPTSVLVTGFDIIFFWVARMVMMGLFFGKEVPFREVYIHGLVRDAEGQKMSKSKGNILDPLDLVDGITLESLVQKRTSGMMQPQLAQRIEKATRKEFPDGIAAYGMDALRFTFAALASTGRDIRFDLGRVGGYRNFCNKLWNAARYVLMNTEGKDCGQDTLEPKVVELSLADRWIVSRLQHAEAEVIGNLDTYRFDLAAQALYEFVWYEFCDWYLELSKPTLQSGTEAAQRGTRRTLVRVLEALLRLAHPFMPFITEEIWQRVAPLAACRGDTIMLQPYPQPSAVKRDPRAEEEMAWLQGFILGLRQIRGEMDIAPSKALPVLIVNASPSDIERLSKRRPLIDFLARVQDIRILGDTEEPPESATALLGSMKILVPMAGLIDKNAEIARLQKLIDARRKAVASSETRLANGQFVNNAPKEVVDKERASLAEHQRAMGELQKQLGRIRAL